MRRSRDVAPRAVLAAGLALGGVYLWYTLALKPAFGVNFRVYRAAARAALAGRPFYDVVPAGLPATYTYLYPPGTVVLFYPFAVAGETVGYVAFTALSALAAVALGSVLVWTIERERGRLPWLDRLLVTGFVLGSSLSVPSLVYGNVNLFLALLVAVGFAAFDRVTARREALAGVALAVPAALKLFPGLFGLELLRERAWRAVGAAIATGGALVLAGVVLFGVDVHVRYLREVVLARLSRDVAAGGVAPAASYVTLRRPLAALGVPPDLLTPVAAALLGAVLVTLYRRAGVDRRVAVLATVVAAIVVVPAYPLYFVLAYYPLVSLLYLVEARPARPLLLSGALLMHVAVQADDLALLADVLGLDAPTALSPLLAVATPPLWGALLVLAGCLACPPSLGRTDGDAPDASA